MGKHDENTLHQMRRIWITVGILLCSLGSRGQQWGKTSENLIYNPSFEEYINCPKKIESLGVLLDVEAWYQPTAGSADYFNVCGGRDCRVPKNKLGTQEAHSGNGYCGIYCSKDDYREYIQTQLKEPLKQGKQYRLSFYVSLSEYSSAAVATIGGYFSKERIEDTTRRIIMHRSTHEASHRATQTLSSYYHAQVENPFDSILSDTERWQKIEGIFTAEGGEEFLTIGNFNTAAHSNVAYPDTLTYVLPGAYYYIDDIELRCIDCEEDTLMVQPTQGQEETTYMVGSTIILKNIYFEFDKSTILQQSYKELSKLIQLLEKHPRMKIEIRGHTDNQGSDKYNKKLSEHRAEAVVEYLVKRGIDARRLTFKGYGKELPIDTNDTEEGRSNNRRVEFKVIKN